MGALVGGGAVMINIHALNPDARQIDMEATAYVIASSDFGRSRMFEYLRGYDGNERKEILRLVAEFDRACTGSITEPGIA